MHLQESDKILYEVVNNANSLILYLDPAGKTVVFNKTIEQISGLKKEELIGRHWSEILYHNSVNPLKQQMFQSVLDDTIIYKRSSNFEGVVVDKDNKELVVSWGTTAILNESGDLEGILLVGNDVTVLKEREASLKNIDETLKNIFSSIKEYALFVVNLDGNITYYGMGSEVMFGWQKNEIIFKHLSLLFTPDARVLRLPHLLEQVRSAGQFEIEMELMRKDTVLFPVVLTVNQFLDKQGTLSGFIFIAKDITERRKLEYQIFQAEKLAAIGQLAAGMAHEINNPLFVISGRLEMLLEQKRIAQHVRESLGIVSEQADRIRKLVDQLLKFARRAPTRVEAVNVNDVIESVLPLIAYHKLPSSRVEVVKDFEPGLKPAKADFNQLQEVFVNLLLNAYQSMPEGGTLRIVTKNYENTFAEIRISDTGKGIPAQSRKNLFMPFFSTKRDGTGLGLSICYNIIKNHNGSIDIESQEGAGTTFVIRLPLA